MKHIRQAEDRAETLAEFREEEVLFLGHDIREAELYENSYRDFVEHGRYKLAMKRLANVAEDTLYTT